MPDLKEVNTRQYRKISTGADYNRPVGVLKDEILIVDTTESGYIEIQTGFYYNMGINELEVYLNGILLRSIQTIDGIDYGEYSEYSNYSVLFEPLIITTGDILRFRVTSANYRNNGSGLISISNIIDSLQTQQNNILRLAREIFGSNYSFIGGGATPLARAIGVITVGDATPDLSDRHAWFVPALGVTVTNFDGCLEGDIRYLIFQGNNTIQNNANIKLNNATNFSAVNLDTLTIIFDGTIWYELARSVNT